MKAPMKGGLNISPGWQQRGRHTESIIPFHTAPSPLYSHPYSHQVLELRLQYNSVQVLLQVIQVRLELLVGERERVSMTVEPDQLDLKGGRSGQEVGAKVWGATARLPHTPATLPLHTLTAYATPHPPSS